jgi:hypothetical protein
MFRDAEGRYCAVANLVHRDGRDDLVDTVVREHNDLAIHDVHEGPILAWALESGLTQEELERIQFPSQPLGFLDQRPPKPRRPTPVDLVAAKAAPVTPPRPPAFDEEAMKSQVRAHLAEVEAELRSHTDASLAIAVARAQPPSVRVASR